MSNTTCVTQVTLSGWIKVSEVQFCLPKRWWRVFILKSQISTTIFPSHPTYTVYYTVYVGYTVYKVLYYNLLIFVIPFERMN